MSTFVCAGEETSIARIISAPISLAISTGRLFTIPPSTKSASPHSTGANIVGIDREALSAFASEPSLIMTSFPEIISNALQRNGIGKLSKS